MIDLQDDYKQIDDIIDVRKKLGQYNVHKQSINYRYAYSQASTAAVPPASDKFVRFDDTIMTANEGDYLNNNNSDLKLTDSEITVVRVRCDGLKRKISKWDMHNDIAIPGDGSHLGESPSLVNLATLVQQNDEYLVPLSSWDPYYNTNNSATPVNNEETQSAQGMGSMQLAENSLDENMSELSEENSMQVNNTNNNNRRHSLAGRISKFFRNHWRKSKTLPEECCQQNNEKTTKY